EQTCDQVAIIDRGKLVLTGRVADVLHQAARPSLVVGIADRDAAATVLRRAGLTADLEGSHLRVGASFTDAARITELLASAGLYLHELRPGAVSLEDLFLSITAHEEE